MAGTVYALLVGIDAYLPPVNALYGCGNDIANLEAFLNGRLGTRLQPKKLLDGDATREAIATAFASHLGQAGSGDVALFYYSGHGTEEPAPPQFAALEPSGKLQVLVSIDAGRRVGGKLKRGLADKELALLIDGVAANGPHVVIVLDCCHSGNGTRDPEARPRQWLPLPELADAEHRADVEELARPRDVGDFLAGAVDRWATLGVASTREAGTSSEGVANHVALAACQSFEVAKEQPTDGKVRGAFSVAFLGALEALGPDTTYRTLLATVRSRVERAAAEQTPVLYPVEVDGPGDGRVFDGSVHGGAPTFHMTTTANGFEIDAGSVHGLTAPSDGQAYELTCTGPDGKVAGLVRVTAVDIGTSTVEPIGWKPDDIAYDAVISVVPLPPAVVSFDKVDGADAAVDLVRAAIANAGGPNVPSPHVRVADPSGPAPAGALVLRVAAHPDGYTAERSNADGTTTSTAVAGACFRILRADGTPIVADVAGVDAAAAGKVVAQLEHIAQWELLRGLGDHPSKPARRGPPRRVPGAGRGGHLARGAHADHPQRGLRLRLPAGERHLRRAEGVHAAREHQRRGPLRRPARPDRPLRVRHRAVPDGATGVQAHGVGVERQAGPDPAAEGSGGPQRRFGARLAQAHRERVRLRLLRLRARCPRRPGQPRRPDVTRRAHLDARPAGRRGLDPRHRRRRRRATTRSAAVVRDDDACRDDRAVAAAPRRSFVRL